MKKCLLVVILFGSLASSGFGQERTWKDMLATSPGLTLRQLEIVRDEPENREDWNAVTAMAESPDGRLLAWGDWSGTVRLYSFGEKKIRIVLRSPDREKCSFRMIKDIAFRDDGKLLWLDLDRNAMRADLGNKDKPKILRITKSKGYGLPRPNLLPTAMVSQYFKSALAPMKSILLVSNLETGKTRRSEVLFPEYRGDDPSVENLAVSHDGKFMVAVAWADSALLSLPDLKILRRVGEDRGSFAAFSPSSKRFALGTDNRGIFVWETASGKLVGHVPFPRGTRMSPIVFVAEDVLYTHGFGAHIHRVDLGTGQVVNIGFRINATVMILSRSKDRLITGCHHGDVGVYELPEQDKPKPEMKK